MESTTRVLEPVNGPDDFPEPAVNPDAGEPWGDEEPAGPTCPECEKAAMFQDDHVWNCPACGYETGEPWDDDPVGDYVPPVRPGHDPLPQVTDLTEPPTKVSARGCPSCGSALAREGAVERCTNCGLQSDDPILGWSPDPQDGVQMGLAEEGPSGQPTKEGTMYDWGYHSSDEGHVHVALTEDGVRRELFDVALYDPEVVDDRTGLTGQEQSLADLKSLLAAANASLSRSEISLLIQALDSHEYWQLSEPDQRNDVSSQIEDGENEEIDACRALSARLSQMREAGDA